MKNTPRVLDAATARRIAVEASCDPRTVQRVYANYPVRGDAGARARIALVRHGLLDDATSSAQRGRTA